MLSILLTFLQEVDGEEGRFLNTESSTTKVEEVRIKWYVIVIVIVLILLSGFFNGNNIGTMGCDENYLELLTKGPFESKKEEIDA
jgi:hypothetical protein